MAAIMTKQGNLDNIVTYEHICDTFDDIQTIDPHYITLGSTCVVINGESGGLEVYMANSEKEWVSLSIASESGEGSSSLGIQILGSNDYDSETGVPTIEEPIENVFYLVPSNDDSNNMYNEWVYVNNDWELFGSSGDISNKVDKIEGKGLSTNDYTTAEKNKLANIEAGAQVNTLTGVKGNSESEYRVGNVNITKANIGLGSVDNTSDANKPISNAQQQALSKKIGVSNLKGAAAIRKFLSNAIGCLNSLNKSVDGLTLYGKSIQNGIPSSDNPVNIISAGSSGSIKLCSIGRNLADMSLITASTSNDGVHDEIEVYGVQIASSNGTVSFSGTATDVVIVRGLIITLPVGRYKLSGCPSGGNTESYRVEVRATDTTVLSRDYGEGNEFEITEPTRCRVCIRIASGYNATGIAIRPVLSSVSIETNETAISSTVNIPTPNGLHGVPVEENGTYIDDNGQQWICDTIDKVSGTYTKRCGYIASYNGETISGRWLSSTDVYSENGSPSVGSAVVYCLTEPVVSQLTLAQLTAFDKVKSHDEYTLMFIKDDALPDMYAEIFIDIPKSISDDDNVAIDFNGFATKVFHISESDITIVAEENARYICGEVSTLECTPSNSGIVDIIFTSGSSKTILTLPSTVKMPDWFEVEANMTYEISIMDGVYGVVTSWAV